MLSEFIKICFYCYIQGFETRGTEIGNRQVTWDNLIRVLDKGTELIDDITRIPSNILPQHYGDIDLRKIDILEKFVCNILYSIICAFKL